MANQYPAVFRDDNSETRLAGTVDFTDPVNQPGFQTVSVTLHDAQIKALPTTSASPPYGFQIVADPADATTLVVPLLVTLSLRGVAYTNVGTSIAIIAHAGFSDGDLSPRFSAGSMLASPPNDIIMPLIFFAGLDGFGHPVSTFPVSVGVGLVLYMDNTLSDFTGGNAANTLTVNTQYLSISVPA